MSMNVNSKRMIVMVAHQNIRLENYLRVKLTAKAQLSAIKIIWLQIVFIINLLDYCSDTCLQQPAVVGQRAVYFPKGHL